MANEAVEMEPSGRVLPIFRGEYDAGRTYENPDIVLYRNSSYVAKQVTVGNPPPAHALADDYWQMVARGIIDADISESTVEFEEAKERANIKSGEKSNIIMGKIMKFFTDLKDIAFSGSYSDLYNKPLSLPASDVYTWAKQATKPAYTKSEVGLGNVNNTSDKDKPVSTAQQTALDKKVNFTDITRSTAVNIAGKKALDAMEKNPSVEGTLAHDISQIYSNLDNVNLLDVYYYFLDNAYAYINDFDNITHPIIFTHLENAPEDDNPAGSYWVFVLTLKRQQQSVQICFSIGANIIKFRTKDGENVTKWQQI